MATFRDELLNQLRFLIHDLTHPCRVIHRTCGNEFVDVLKVDRDAARSERLEHVAPAATCGDCYARSSLLDGRRICAVIQ
jgi:hypothetical protein